MPADCSSPESAENCLAVVEILLRHLDAVAQLERLKVRRRDAADDGQRDRLLIVSARRRCRAGGISQRAILAPKIDLVAGGQFGIEGVEYLRGIAGRARALAGGGGAKIERGQQGRAGDTGLCVRFLDAGDGGG